MKSKSSAIVIIGLAISFLGCAPIEYSVVVVEASQAIAEAEMAGASCTDEQLDSLSPTTKNLTPDPGTALATTEDEPATPEQGEPTWVLFSPLKIFGLRDRCKSTGRNSDIRCELWIGSVCRIFPKNRDMSWVKQKGAQCIHSATMIAHAPLMLALSTGRPEPARLPPCQPNEAQPDQHNHYIYARK